MIQHIAFSSNGVNEHAKRQQMNLPAMLECAFKQVCALLSSSQ